MCWFAEGRIDIDYVLLQNGWCDNLPPIKSDHSFCIRQDTASNTKKRVKLPRNNHAPSSNELSPEAAQSDSSSAECSSPTSHAQTSNGASSISASLLFSKPASPSLPKMSSSAKEAHSPPNKVPIPCNKRPISGTSTFSKKFKTSTKGMRSSNEHPCAAKKPQPSTPTGRLPGTWCGSSSTAIPSPKTATSPETTTNSVKAPKPSMKTNSSDHPSTSPRSTTSSVATPPSPEADGRSSPNSVRPSNTALNKFQCEHCGLQLSSRNCLYKHKKRKHTATHEVSKAKGSKYVICPECKGEESR